MPTTLSTRKTLARSSTWTVWTQMPWMRCSKEGDRGSEVSYETGRVLGPSCGKQGDASTRGKRRREGGLSHPLSRVSSRWSAWAPVPPLFLPVRCPQDKGILPLPSPSMKGRHRNGRRATYLQRGDTGSGPREGFGRSLAGFFKA